MSSSFGLLLKTIITGIPTLIVCIALWFIFYSEKPTDTLAWITVSISTGIGIIIALIVDDKAQKSQLQVLASQETISDILGKLKTTDENHQEALDMLNDTRSINETTAKSTVVDNLEFVSDIVTKLLVVISKVKGESDGQISLINRVLPHLESPINLIAQALPQTGSQITPENIQSLTSEIAKIRKFLILTALGTDLDVKVTISQIETINVEVKKILEKIKGTN